ncbi:MAG: aldehyde dehydrogenase EutE [Clostridiales bacterium]|jgi:propionaldehyde dehydrogenase|nr:aldehyde dehydrogenase EutE [Clostridiales bacterium]
MNEALIRQIAETVLKELRGGSGSDKDQNGIFTEMSDAIEAAKNAAKVLRALSLDAREKIIQAVRASCREHAGELAKLAVEETGMGDVAHKTLKHILVADKTPGTEDLSTVAWSGDKGLTLVEQGPFGVVGAVTPCTNPGETIFCNAIGMLAAGNAVVFNPHPNAVKTSNLAVRLINEASERATGHRQNVVFSVVKPTLAAAEIMFRSPDISLLVATGGTAVVTAILSSGKRGIGAGAGNPPVLVDETADIAKAAADIIDGCTFDNNLPCIAEKEVVAVESVHAELIERMTERGAYLASPEVIESLVKVVFTDKGALNRACVGRSAKALLHTVGVTVSDDIRCIIFPAAAGHIFVQDELMMPILGIVKAKDFDEALDMCVQMEHGNRHSAHIHSKNVDRLTRYAKAIDTAILVKNAPSYAAIGFNGEGFCTFTIASRTGEGLTSAKTFTKSRRCVMSDALCIR